LVVEERSGADVAYSLHHPLIGEVAYAELAEVARRRTHLAVALALECHQPENLDRLAYHYRAAGSEADRDRAFELLFAAGSVPAMRTQMKKPPATLPPRSIWRARSGHLGVGGSFIAIRTGE
jgi:predicted ATPase